MLKVKEALCVFIAALSLMVGFTNAQEVYESTDAKNLNSEGPVMDCFVDTRLDDDFSAFTCIGIEDRPGRQYSTARFRIRNFPSNFTILWSDDRCNSNNTQCVLPIRVYRPVRLDATVIDNNNGVSSSVSAIAFYEDFR